MAFSIVMEVCRGASSVIIGEYIDDNKVGRLGGGVLVPKQMSMGLKFIVQFPYKAHDVVHMIV
jgi:hypothetical protein